MRSGIQKHNTLSPPDRRWGQSDDNDDPHFFQPLYPTTPLTETQPFSATRCIWWRPPAPPTYAIIFCPPTHWRWWLPILDYLMSPVFLISSFIYFHHWNFSNPSPPYQEHKLLSDWNVALKSLSCSVQEKWEGVKDMGHSKIDREKLERGVGWMGLYGVGWEW